MPSEKEVYEAHAGQYDRLVAREDYQSQILPAIEEILTLDGLEVVELGAGTGRLTRLLAPHVSSVHAFDTSHSMLKVARANLQGTGLSNWSAGLADHRRIPMKGGTTDLVISGWSFCYLAVWGDAEWRTALQAGLDEIRRLLRPGGTILLLETLGTGHTTPRPPGHLTDYFSWLEALGFQSRWIRTDYKFESDKEARELTHFFFGDGLADKIDSNILPECTGLWWKQL